MAQADPAHLELIRDLTRQGMAPEAVAWRLNADGHYLQGTKAWSALEVSQALAEPIPAATEPEEFTPIPLAGGGFSDAEKRAARAELDIESTEPTPALFRVYLDADLMHQVKASWPRLLELPEVKAQRPRKTTTRAVLVLVRMGLEALERELAAK